MITAVRRPPPSGRAPALSPARSACQRTRSSAGAIPLEPPVGGRPGALLRSASESSGRPPRPPRRRATLARARPRSGATPGRGRHRSRRRDGRRPPRRRRRRLGGRAVRRDVRAGRDKVIRPARHRPGDGMRRRGRGERGDDRCARAVVRRVIGRIAIRGLGRAEAPLQRLAGAATLQVTGEPQAIRVGQESLGAGGEKLGYEGARLRPSGPCPAVSPAPRCSATRASAGRGAWLAAACRVADRSSTSGSTAALSGVAITAARKRAKLSAAASTAAPGVTRRSQ